MSPARSTAGASRRVPGFVATVGYGEFLIRGSYLAPAYDGHIVWGSFACRF